MALKMDRRFIEEFLNQLLAAMVGAGGTSWKLQIYTTSTTVPVDMNYSTISGNVGGTYTPLLATPFAFNMSPTPTATVNQAKIILPFPTGAIAVINGGTPAFYILYSDTGGYIGPSGKLILNLGEVTTASGVGPLKLATTFPLTIGQTVKITDFTWSMAGMTVV